MVNATNCGICPKTTATCTDIITDGRVCEFVVYAIDRDGQVRGQTSPIVVFLKSKNLYDYTN